MLGKQYTVSIEAAFQFCVYNRTVKSLWQCPHRLVYVLGDVFSVHSCHHTHTQIFLPMMLKLTCGGSVHKLFTIAVPDRESKGQ